MAGVIRRIVVVARPALAEFGSRRRAGLDFTREPRELGREELPEGIEGLRAFLAIATDPHLVVSIGDEDGDVRLINEDEIAELRLGLEKLELAEIDRVDPANPPSVLTELQTLGGSKSETEGAAAPTGDDAEKVADADQSSTADPAKAGDAPTASTEQARERADDAAADQKVASDAGQEPGDAAQPPVVGTDTAREDSQPAGEETASPAAEAKPRGAAKKAGAKS